MKGAGGRVREGSQGGRRRGTRRKEGGGRKERDTSQTGKNIAIV